jgi:replicative DNA helicase
MFKYCFKVASLIFLSIFRQKPINIMLEHIQLTNAERQLLGLFLNQIDATGESPSYYQVSSILDEADFYDENNRIVYESLTKLINGPGLNSSLDLFEHLRGIPEYTGDYQHFATLITGPCGLHQAEQFAQKIKEKSLLRKLYTLSENLQLDCIKPKADAFEVLANAERILTESNASLKSDEISTYEALNAVYDKAEKATKQDFSKQVRWPNELNELNRISGGMTKGDFIILAARPGRGKTALAIQTAVNCAIHGQRVAFVSVEMTKEKLLQRVIKPKGVSDVQVNEGSLSHEQLEEMSLNVARYGEIFNDTLEVFDRNIGQIDQLVSKVKGSHARNPFDMLIVDYLQLLAGHRGADAYQRVTDVSMSLTQLTKSLNVPCICLAQLSRAVEQRSDKRPQLSDLRDSGQIEQDASQVFFIAPHPEDIEDKSKAIITCEKNRNGRLGLVFCDYEGVNYKFIQSNN